MTAFGNYTSALIFQLAIALRAVRRSSTEALLALDILLLAVKAPAPLWHNHVTGYGSTHSALCVIVGYG